MKGSKMSREIKEGRLTVALTDDAYSYNDVLFTLEATYSGAVFSDECENDGDVSGLTINASEEQIATYLQAAFDSVQEQMKNNGNSVRNTTMRAAEAGMKSVGMLDVLEEKKAPVGLLDLEFIYRKQAGHLTVALGRNRASQTGAGSYALLLLVSFDYLNIQNGHYDLTVDCGLPLNAYENEISSFMAKALTFFQSEYMKSPNLNHLAIYTAKHANKHIYSQAPAGQEA